MKQINIVSNTTNERVGLHKEDILFLKDFYLSRISNGTSIVELDKSDMTLLKGEIEKLIDQKLSERTDIVKPNVKLVYKEVEYNLDFRNHNDFIIGTMISIYLIVDSTIKLSGIISIYSPDAPFFVVFYKDRCCPDVCDSGQNNNALRSRQNKIKQPNFSKKFGRLISRNRLDIAF